MNKPPIFITAGPIHFGSSRMRAFWPAKYIHGAEVITAQDYKPGIVNYSQFGAVVLQKVWDDTIVDAARANGCRVIWDICDPAWWFQPRETRELLIKVDEVTVSSVALGQDLKDFAGEDYCPPITYIPDSIDPDHCPLRREHAQTEELKFVWFGMAVNRLSLYGAVTNLERLAANGYHFSLTILDDMPQAQVQASFPIIHERWRLNTENQVLASMDCAILPPYPGPWGRVKSPNKARTARMCGLPVVSGFDYPELCRMFDMQERIRNADENLTAYYSRLVALAWEEICAC